MRSPGGPSAQEKAAVVDLAHLLAGRGDHPAAYRALRRLPRGGDARDLAEARIAELAGDPAEGLSALSRSRVTPGRSCTIAIRFRAIQLNRADFPTLGRPTMATTPGTQLL